ALVALLADFLGAPLWLQIVIFVVVAGLCVAILYRKLRRNISKTCEKTNLDAVIGTVAKVETQIPPDGVGRVLVRGISWQASCTAGAEVGEHVRVTAIDGVTLICVPDAPKAPDKPENSIPTP
ncbi:MAG: NfeD family protein, partial [Eubacteriales bacterium]